jgi:hypothetical protein
VRGDEHVEASGRRGEKAGSTDEGVFGSRSLASTPRLVFCLATVEMPKILTKFPDFSSHRIFKHMYEALNIDKK